MKNCKHAWMAALAGLLFAPALHAAASDMRDHAIDKQGRPILDARGNCVYTKWEVANASCNGRTQIKNEERVIFFDFNKSTIKASERKKLDSLIKKIKGAKDIVDVNVIGHTDQIGTNSYNKRLSVRRAEAVRDYLRKYGHIRTRKIEVHGVGEAQPVTTCGKELARAERIRCMAKDRRVEIELNYKK